MADRPRNDGPEDGPEYTWLYGKDKKAGNGGTPDDATRPVRRPPDPAEDATRVMPVQPRGQRSGSSAGPADAARRPAATPRPVAPPPAAPPAAGRAGPARGRRRPRFRLKWLLALLLLWVVFLVAVPIYAWTQVSKVDYAPDGERPGEQPGTTYLMVGSDSRAGLTAAERKALGTGDAEGQRTDTIMLLHTGSGPNLLMSIPRDSIVEVPGQGTNKINAAYALGGPQLLVQTIENETGIRVDNYVEIGFGGVVDVVDAVGGIEICPRTAMNDPLAKLDVEKGCQEADGATALGYARSRKTQTLGDIDRSRNQREVVSAVGKKVVSPWTVLNPFRYWGITMAAPDSFAFGDSTGPLGAAMWASAMTHVNGENGLTCGVPIADLAVNWDEERSQQMFDAIKQDKTDNIGKDLCTPSGLPKSVTG